MKGRIARELEERKKELGKDSRADDVMWPISTAGLHLDPALFVPSNDDHGGVKMRGAAPTFFPESLFSDISRPSVSATLDRFKA